MTEVLIFVILGPFLAGFTVYFAWGFARPWWRMRKGLARATGQFDDRFQRAKSAGRHVTELAEIDAELADDRDISHLWVEFRDTLHGERSEADVDEYGQPLIRYRQTVPAEVYFSSRALIDGPLRTDFFRHLPGILTGLGIIGTFIGLIFGLADFNISGDPDQVNRNVESLIDAVRSAFMFSAAAIIMAIIITAVEKLMVADLYGHAQRLQQVIDSMFDAGAGEDYLAEIARGSEQTATHLGHLKEGMINELRPLFDNLADRQETASLAAAELIGEKVNSTLESPLERMTVAMEKSLDDQQMVVHELMDRSLATFAQRLEEMVGEKLTGSAEHIEAAASQMREAMQQAPQQLEAAVARIREVLDDVVAAMRPMSENAVRISDAADKLATTVEQSAETLDYGLERFKSLGAELEKSVESASWLTASLNEGAAQAKNAADAVKTAATHFESTASQLQSVVEGLAETAERYEHDSDAHRELAEAVERAAQQLSGAQSDVDAFLSGLADALTETHAAFSREINNTLGRTHEAFHQNLATATEQLAGATHDFGEFLENDFRESVDQLQREMSRLADNGSTPES